MMMLLLLLLLLLDDAHKAVANPPQNSPEVVCNSMRITSHVNNLRVLRNCTVIEGSLAIILIDNAKPGDFDAVSFPHLREIGSYLLLYRLYGLRSLARLFPNLAVIRGQLLFFNYALVVYEVPDMEDLGLVSLRSIVRGAVRIEKNPQLCYVDTIDWRALTSVDQEDDFVLQNKDPSQCTNVCPRLTTHSCPSMTWSLGDGAVIEQELCWNSDRCQTICPARCSMIGRACNRQLTMAANQWQCCHQECLAGCYGPLETQCIACVHVTYNGRCLRQCPHGTYQLRERRCISAQECWAYAPVRSKTPPIFKTLPEGLCVPLCPPGSVEDPHDRHRCVKCPGPCPKECKGIVVQNLAAAQRLKGCTIIKGVLEIQILGGFHVNAELEENLGMIEEITNYLKVLRSYPLTSLKFLKNLKVIHGERLYSERYALFVFDNDNLQDTWDFTASTANLTIKNGVVFFQYNPKLCARKIYELLEVTGLTNQVDTIDVSPTTNGDGMACYMSVLELELVAVKSSSVFLRWKNYALESRRLLSWVVSYRQTDVENMSISTVQDECTALPWKTVDVTMHIGNDTDMGVVLYDLEPFTKYAIYVQAYSTALSKTSHTSPIVYFVTEPSEPSPARNTTAVAEFPNELRVSWQPPSSPNGDITHYYVYWQPQSLSPEMFERRNYCIDKLRQRAAKKPTSSTQPSDSQNVTSSEAGACCGCPKTAQQLLIEQQERLYQTEFENFLLSSLYERKLLTKNYEIVHLHPTENTSNIRAAWKDAGSVMADPLWRNSTSANWTDTVNETLDLAPYEAAIVFGTNEITLTNLKHYQEYNIEVVACHDYREGYETKACSNRAVVSARTLPDSAADTLNAENISVIPSSSLSSSMLIQWMDPPTPNGLIVLYDVELSRVEVSNYKPDVYCVPHRQFRRDRGYITQTLAAGRWSVRIRSTSLAGNGSWTPHVFFDITKPYTSQQQLSVAVVSVISIACVIVVVVIVVLLSIFVIRKRLNMAMNEDRLYVLSANPHYAVPEEMYIADEWEVPREKIQIGRTIGKGSFGMVYEGTANDIVKNQPNARVAIKTVNEGASVRDRIAFLNEASVMKRFDCHHVVKLLGVVSKGQPTLVVMELMLNGDLKSYLRAHRPDENADKDMKPFSLTEMLQMSGEIADGMAYLASTKFVHRDLAARNCMVAENGTVKIGDFGMARDIYQTDYYRKDTQGMLPVRWMAPESLQDGIFTSPSDVWSYGVVLWEMMTLAEQPYQGLSNEEVLQYIVGGGVMDKPEGCPDRMYNVMLECWRRSAARRPSFMQLLDQLTPDLSEEFRNVSYYFNHEPDDADDDDHSDFVNSRNASVEDISETAPFRSASATQLRSDPSNTTAGNNSTDQKEQSGVLGCSTTEQKPRSAGLIEMWSPPNATTANTAQSSSQPDHHVGDKEHRNSQPSSRETGASCRSDVHGAGDSGSKDSSGSSQGSHKNGLINGHVVPFGSPLPSAVH